MRAHPKTLLLLAALVSLFLGYQASNVLMQEYSRRQRLIWLGLSRENGSVMLDVVNSPNQVEEVATDTDGDGQYDCWLVRTWPEVPPLNMEYNYRNSIPPRLEVSFGAAQEARIKIVFTDNPMGGGYSVQCLRSSDTLGLETCYYDFNFDSRLDAIKKTRGSEEVWLLAMNDAWVPVAEAPSYHAGSWEAVIEEDDLSLIKGLWKARKSDSQAGGQE